MGLVRQALIAAGDDVDGAVTWLHDNEEARAEYAAASSCRLVHDRLPAPPPPHTHIPSTHTSHIQSHQASLDTASIRSSLPIPSLPPTH